MSIDALHPTPARSDVAREQLRAVGLAVRTSAILAAVAMLAFGLLFLVNYVRVERSGWPWSASLDVVPIAAIPAILAALLAPFAIWRGDELERRSYLWAMPVERGRHHLTKTFAGWVWVVAALAVYMLGVWIVGLLTGGEVGVEMRRIFVGADEGRLVAGSVRVPRLEDFRMVAVATPAWQWLAPFTGVTITYLLGSAVVLGSAHPLRWFGGAWLAFIVPLVFFETTHWTPGLRAMDRLFDNSSWYGFLTAMTGALDVRESMTVGGRSVGYVVSRPDLGAWLTATALWLALGVAGTLWAANRHREP